MIIFWIRFECRADETAVVNNMGCERKIPETTARF